MFPGDLTTCIERNRENLNTCRIYASIHDLNISFISIVFPCNLQFAAALVDKNFFYSKKSSTVAKNEFCCYLGFTYDRVLSQRVMYRPRILPLRIHLHYYIFLLYYLYFHADIIEALILMHLSITEKKMKCQTVTFYLLIARDEWVTKHKKKKIEIPIWSYYAQQQLICTYIRRQC